jgi:hypothetical protein
LRHLRLSAFAALLSQTYQRRPPKLLPQPPYGFPTAAGSVLPLNFGRTEFRAFPLWHRVIVVAMLVWMFVHVMFVCLRCCAKAEPDQFGKIGAATITSMASIGP